MEAGAPVNLSGFSLRHGGKEQRDMGISHEQLCGEPDTLAALQSATRLAAHLVGAARSSIFLKDAGGELCLAASSGSHLKLADATSKPGEAGWSRHLGLVGDGPLPPRIGDTERGWATASELAVPLIIGDEDAGLIRASDPGEGWAFTIAELESLRLLADNLGKFLYTIDVAKIAASLDSLTGVLDRRPFEARLAQEVERSHRFGHELTLLLIHLDNLKRVNDLAGRSAGDELLRLTALAIRGTIRQVDLVARFRGDEFAVALPETPEEASLVVARRVESIIKKVFVVSGGAKLSATSSVGLATFPPAASGEQLLDEAERALAIAQRKGDHIHHWTLGSAAAAETRGCECQHCHRTFEVSTATQQRSRRYCSVACTIEARKLPSKSRNAQVLALRAQGFTLREIAEPLGLSRERIRQICRG